MPLIPISDLLVGLYLGLLTGIFPGFIAFAMGFGFKYFTDVSVPGFGVVVLGGALAGISGGLLGLADPQLAGGWTGITAILVVLMIALWAHSQGDKLAANTPRRLSFKMLKNVRVSESLANLVDSYGQVKIRPIGEIEDLEGYPPLTEELRQQISQGSWKFPANLSHRELESRLEERLVTDHDLAEASVHLDPKGRAEISAAPAVAGLSRRIPKNHRAVSVRTLLPSGMAKGDIATIRLPGGEVTGPVVSARTDPDETPRPVEAPPSTEDDEEEEDEESDEEEPAPRIKAPTTRGGAGRVTVAVTSEESKRLLGVESAPMQVETRGKQREYQVLDILKDAGNRFRKVRVPDDHPLVGQTLGTARIRERYDVGVLAIRRPTERVVAPTGQTTLQARDTLTVVGKTDALDAFEEEVAG